jgi:hypothetical protein
MNVKGALFKAGLPPSVNLSFDLESLYCEASQAKILTAKPEGSDSDRFNSLKTSEK